MSDAIPLPSRPNIEHYKKVAKELHRGDAVDEPLRSLWRRFNTARDRVVLADAQFFLARAHGFASWPKFAKHIEELQRADSRVSAFERAADAIVSGDIDTLTQLLREHPELIRERSTREHRSTLLHYVSANGVEDFRQKTPPNIVEIARLLLGAGADINAESDAYGGHSTALHLTATSCHPHDAGVQIPLMQLLLDRGARMFDLAIADCLANGRLEAAEFLAKRGATIDFEAACGIGDVAAAEGLLDRASALERARGLAWACEFAREDVVDVLLARHIDLTPYEDRPTGLHWASYVGHASIVKKLIDAGAPVHAVERMHENTPIGWALYGWREEPDRDGADYYEVVARLVRAGARSDAEVNDPRMAAALRGMKP